MHILTGSHVSLVVFTIGNRHHDNNEATLTGMIIKELFVDSV